MGRYWWITWIKVVVLAVALFFAFRYGYRKIRATVSPYLTKQEESSAVATNSKLEKIFSRVEDTLKVKIDYEDLIFDYAEKYTQKMIEQSKEERSALISDSKSVGYADEN